jgi:hypothetical protein
MVIWGHYGSSQTIRAGKRELLDVATVTFVAYFGDAKGYAGATGEVLAPPRQGSGSADVLSADVRVAGHVGP